MHSATKNNFKRASRVGLLAAVGLALAGCGGMATNNTVYSLKQPVIERENFTLDVNTNASGLPVSEKVRLNGWFEAMDLRYGDRIAIEDPGANPAVADAVNELAGRYGLIVDETAPATSGFVQPGAARVIITRSSASVPECPDWSAKSDMNYRNATSPNFGCGVNSNLAAMVANPEHLLEGHKGDSETTVLTSSKAINAFRQAQPTGAGGTIAGVPGGGGGGGGGAAGGN